MSLELKQKAKSVISSTLGKGLVIDRARAEARAFPLSGSSRLISCPGLLSTATIVYNPAAKAIPRLVKGSAIIKETR